MPGTASRLRPFDGFPPKPPPHPPPHTHTHAPHRTATLCLPSPCGRLASVGVQLNQPIRSLFIHSSGSRASCSRPFASTGSSSSSSRCRRRRTAPRRCRWGGGRTSAALRPHLGRTSAAPRRTSTMHLFVGVQGHFGRGAARTNKHARTRARTRVCVKNFLAHLILPRRGLAARRAAASSAGCLGGRCTWGGRGWSSVRRRLSSRSQRQSHGREASWWQSLHMCSMRDSMGLHMPARFHARRENFTTKHRTVARCAVGVAIKLQRNHNAPPPLAAQNRARREWSCVWTPTCPLSHMNE